MVFVVGVAVMDVATGEEASVSVFYVGPVVIATWVTWPGESVRPVESPGPS